MPSETVSPRTEAASAIQQETECFFARLAEDESGRKLLSELNQSVEFRLPGKSAFRLVVADGRISSQSGVPKQESFDREDVIHFHLAVATLRRLIRGKGRFTDALIPTDPDGKNKIILLDCTLFKWSVLSWVGRLFRQAQLRASSGGARA
jgi:hypothetical protein